MTPTLDPSLTPSAAVREAKLRNFYAGIDTPPGYTEYPRGVFISLPAQDKKKLLARLRRAEGQLTGIGRMIEEDKPCVDTLIQISAIQGALGKIGELVLAEHIESCVADAFQHGDEDQRQAAIEDLMDVFSRYGRTAGR